MSLPKKAKYAYVMYESMLAELAKIAAYTVPGTVNRMTGEGQLVYPKVYQRPQIPPAELARMRAMTGYTGASELPVQPDVRKLEATGLQREPLTTESVHGTPERLQARRDYNEVLQRSGKTYRGQPELEQNLSAAPGHSRELSRTGTGVGPAPGGSVSERPTRITRSGSTQLSRAQTMVHPAAPQPRVAPVTSAYSPTRVGTLPKAPTTVPGAVTRVLGKALPKPAASLAAPASGATRVLGKMKGIGGKLLKAVA